MVLMRRFPLLCMSISSLSLMNLTTPPTPPLWLAKMPKNSQGNEFLC